MGMGSLDDLITKISDKLNYLYDQLDGFAESGVSNDGGNSLSLGTDDKPYFKERTSAEIKSAYESNSDTNAFTDAYKNQLDTLDADITEKLDRGGYAGTAQDLKDDIDGFVSGVSADADNSLILGTDDKPYFKERTDAEIKASYEGNANTNAFTDAEKVTLSTALQSDDLDGYLTEMESDSKYTPLTRTLTAGNGIQAIGDLSQNRNINLDFDYLDDRYDSGNKTRTGCKVATTVNITLSGVQTIDSVALSVNDRVLVKNQTDATKNGSYLVKSSTWVRTSDFDTVSSDEITQSATFYVQEGVMNGKSSWKLQTPNPITLGTSNLIFEQISGASNYIGGNKISLDGNQINHDTGTWTGKSNLSGATVISNLNVDAYGHISNWTTRNLTASDVGATTQSASDLRYLRKDVSGVFTGNELKIDNDKFLMLGNDNIAGLRATYGNSELRLYEGNFSIRDGADARFSFGRTTGNFSATGSITGANLSGINTGDQTWSTLDGKPTTFTPSAHNHDDRYYTEAESDGMYLRKDITDVLNSGVRIPHDAFLFFGNSNISAIRETGGNTEHRLYSGDYIIRDTTSEIFRFQRTTGNFIATGRGVFGDFIQPSGAGGNGVRIRGIGSGSSNVSYCSFYESDGITRQGYVGFPTPSSSNLFLRNEITSKNLQLKDDGVLDYNGIIKADDFNGNGSELTNVNADQVDGFHASSLIKTSGNQTISGRLSGSDATSDTDFVTKRQVLPIATQGSGIVKLVESVDSGVYNGGTGSYLKKGSTSNIYEYEMPAGSFQNSGKGLMEVEMYADVTSVSFDVNLLLNLTIIQGGTTFDFPANTINLNTSSPGAAGYFKFNFTSRQSGGLFYGFSVSDITDFSGTSTEYRNASVAGIDFRNSFKIRVKVSTQNGYSMSILPFTVKVSDLN
ncbi:hypothetical protein [Joostella sp.]|uniref:hypothetical protein n=1 Tax=Joostella sp. TaxID=2231138 RepID=UPI003A8E611D